MAGYRSLLHPLSIQPFALEAPAVLQLPAQPQVQRTNSSVAWGGAVDNFAPLPSTTPLLTHATGHQRTLSISPAPGFFEPQGRSLRGGYESTNNLQSSVSAFLNPPALARQQAVQQTQSAFFSPLQPQPVQQQVVQYQQPLALQQAKISFVPSVGTSNYWFQPWLELGSHSNERGAPQEVFSFQNMHIRPEFVDRSPEELRAEDYAQAGIASLCNNPVQPGPVDMGLAKPSSNVFQVPPFGTQTVGLFGSPSPAAPQQGRSAFFGGLAPLLPPLQTQGAFFQPQPQPQQQNYFAQPQQQAQVPVWGTATAGFGNGWQQPQTGFSTFAPQPVWGAQPQQQSAFGFQPQQQQPFAFGAQQQSAFAPAFGGGFNTGFGGQQPNFGFGFQSFQQPQPLNLNNLSSFNFGSSQSWLSQKVYQVPQQASMFWNLSATETFAAWLRTLPYLRGHTLNMACFGGVQVATPSVETVMRMREEERMKIAQPDDDPYGLHLIQKVEPLPPPMLVGSTLEATEPNVRSTSAVVESNSGVPSSPLKRGSSSPPLLVSPTRSPSLLSKNHGRGSDSSLLQVPGLGLGGSMIAPGGGSSGQHSRSGSNCSALLSHSPRLGPLPESPYLDPAALGSTAIAGPAHSHSPPVRSQTLSAAQTHTPAAPSTPERAGRSTHFSSVLHGSLTPQSNPRSILFGSQADAPAHHSPHRALSAATTLGIPRTPELSSRKMDSAQRELEWTSRLVA